MSPAPLQLNYSQFHFRWNTHALIMHATRMLDFHGMRTRIQMEVKLTVMAFYMPVSVTDRVRTYMYVYCTSFKYEN